jgi:hypothetical protein
MSIKLNEIYRSILLFSGLEADDKGYISSVLDGKKSPAFIDGRHMVLPLDSQLRNFNQDERIIFHPLSEGILRGESEVLAKLKNVINVKLNFTIGILASNLLELISSPEFHKRFTPEQAELLTSVNEADSKTSANFTSLMVQGVKNGADRTFVNIYLKRGGTHKQKRYARVGVVSFQMYEQLIADKIDKIRVKDKETFKQLFEFMFPNIQDTEEYNFGSESNIAPYLECLLRTAANVASRLNDLLVLYGEFMEDYESFMFDSDWMEHFTNIDALQSEIRKVPVQFGNEGEIIMLTETAPVAQQTMQQVQPVNTVMPMPMQTPMMNMQPPAAPEIRKTKGGIDFQSLVNASPRLQAAPNALHNQLNQNMRPQFAHQQPPPSWAGTMQTNMTPPIGTMVTYNNATHIVTPQGPMPFVVINNTNCIMTPNGAIPIVQLQNGTWTMVQPQQQPQNNWGQQQPQNYGYRQ